LVYIRNEISWLREGGANEMNLPVKIGIIGDLDPSHPSRIATDAALSHAATVLSEAIDISWLPTRMLEQESVELALKPFDALFCAPGSPYESMDGALEGIRFAREKDRPFVAT
jgi:CTP synthase (UTP-ammonia lyase)